MIIKHPRYNALMEKIRDCHLLSKGAKSADCLFIWGYTGVGKSTLLKQYAEKYPREILPEHIRIPILYLKLPVGATPKSVATSILEALGDPAYEKGTEINQTQRAFHFVKACEVEMIILDEFQHLIDSETKSVLRKASDWVKRFAEEVNVSVVLCGMPESEKIFRQNEQLDRRFMIRDELKPFTYNTREEQKEFRSFLATLDRNLPFREPSHLADPGLAEKLFYISMGVPSYIKKLLEEATVYAARHGQDAITEDYLSLAYNNIQRSTRPHAINPFEIDNFNLVDEIKKEERAMQISMKVEKKNKRK